MRFSLLLLLLFFISCTAKNSSKDSQSPDSISFLLNPKVDTSYNFRITTNNIITQEFQSQKIGSNTRSTVNLTCQFKVDSNNNISAILRLEDFILDSKSGDHNNNFNVALASSSLRADERALCALYKASISAIIDKSGKIYRIIGVDKIKQRMYELVGNQTSNKEQIIERVNQ